MKTPQNRPAKFPITDERASNLIAMPHVINPNDPEVIRFLPPDTDIERRITKSVFSSFPYFGIMKLLVAEICTAYPDYENMIIDHDRETNCYNLYLSTSRKIELGIPA